jgi:hypothetical protein
MAFRDLTEIIGPLELPIRGKVYTLPVVKASDGAKVLATSRGEGNLTDSQMRKILLGDVETQLKDAGATSFEINRVVWTALADVQGGRAVAEVIWENGIDPKALTETTAPNRAARRSKALGAANTTKRPASTSTTKKA